MLQLLKNIEETISDIRFKMADDSKEAALLVSALYSISVVVQLLSEKEAKDGE